MKVDSGRDIETGAKEEGPEPRNVSQIEPYLPVEWVNSIKEGTHSVDNIVQDLLAAGYAIEVDRKRIQDLLVAGSTIKIDRNCHPKPPSSPPAKYIDLISYDRTEEGIGMEDAPITIDDTKDEEQSARSESYLPVDESLVVVPRKLFFAGAALSLCRSSYVSPGSIAASPGGVLIRLTFKREDDGLGRGLIRPKLGCSHFFKEQECISI
ncbi:hypothetical protein R1sor_013948 [Riccia sorocarpa]|uniref:Uncharacterized protein n=1 Tax=Riccia sorocarpa TaxID=122646 RepID=A0ABD3HBV9_9MARC